MLLVELIDRAGMPSFDVSIPHMLSHHRSVLGLHQSVIVGSSRPRLGLLHQKFVQQPGHRMVDEFAAIVGMEAANQKWELLHHRFQHWHQPHLADLLCRSHYLPLRHFIHCIDVIDALVSIPVPLMHCVHPQVSWSALRIGLSSLPDIHRCWPRCLISDPSFAICSTLAQVVNVSHRDLR